MLAYWAVIGLLSLITVLQLLILKGLFSIMAKEQDLEQKFDAIIAAVAEVAQEIKDLKEQIATEPVTQEQLDSLDAKAQAVLDALNAAK